MRNTQKLARKPRATLAKHRASEADTARLINKADNLTLQVNSLPQSGSKFVNEKSAHPSKYSICGYRCIDRSDQK